MNAQDFLPPFVHELTQVVGQRAALELVKARGGISLYVPITPIPQHWLSSVLTAQELKQLCREYGGTEIVLPRCEKAIRHNLHMQILQDLKTHSQAEVAQKYQYTQRSIERIVNRYKHQTEHKQLDLDL